MQIPFPSNQSTPNITWREPNRFAALWHWLKVSAHIAIRTCKNHISGPRKITHGHQLINAPLIAEHRSALWIDDRDDEFILGCGKVENLRQAMKSADSKLKCYFTALSGVLVQ
jgi:hypothetical protein